MRLEWLYSDAQFRMYDAQRGFLANGDSLYRTTNGGRNWHADGRSYRGYASGMHWRDAQTGWVARRDWEREETKVWRTDDGGVSWTSYTNSELRGGELFDLTEIAPDQLFGLHQLSDRLVVVASLDGGASWAVRYGNTGIGSDAYSHRNLHYTDGRLYLPTDGGFLLQLDTLGNLLPGIDTGAEGLVRPLLIRKELLVVGTDSGIRRSTDGGLTWTAVDSHPAFLLAQQDNQLWAGQQTICNNGDVLRVVTLLGYSNDAGLSWRWGPPSAVAAWDLVLQITGDGQAIALSEDRHFLLERQ